MGKGNPFKRGETWTFIYYTKDEFGNYKQHWKGGYKTKAEAEKDMKIYKAKVTLGEVISSETATVSSFLDDWFGFHIKTIESSTANSYRNSIEKHIKPFLGNKKLKYLKVSDIKKFYAYLETDVGLSVSTIAITHVILRTALKSAVADKLIPDNPCNYVKLPEPEKHKAVLLSADQLSQLFEYLNGHRYETEIKLACLHGLRRGEVLGIRESDVDFEKHTLSITQQVATTKVFNVDGKDVPYYGIKKLKSRSSQRTLELSDVSEYLIKERMAVNKANRKKYEDIYEDNGLLCPAEDGRPLNPLYLYQAFKKVIKHLGLPDMRFHDLRHSYATLCIDLNIPIKVISDALGHSNAVITSKVYADSIQAKKELANKVADAITKNK